MTEDQILELFEETGALLKGHFLLSSGLHSGRYLQCARVLMHPPHAEAICGLLAEKMRTCSPDCVTAPALGGVIVSHEVARRLGVRALL